MRKEALAEEMSPSESAESSRGQVSRISADFAVRRLFSLSGVIPLGAFVVFHVVDLCRSWGGPSDFVATPGYYSHTRLAAEALLLGVPLGFHALYGLRLSLTSRVNAGSYPYAFTWAHALQRVSGVVAIFFVLWHTWQTRVRVLLGQRAPQDFYTDLAGTLSSTGIFGIPFAALGYLLGVAAVTYHLANGVAGFAASFGLVRSAKSHRKLSLYCLGCGLLLFCLGTISVIHFATGWPAFLHEAAR
jgi:succinate dehydrogenase/fumarate reductase cytochrome b subunit (b558 family)